MLNFTLLILEIFIIGFMIVSMHYMRKHIGYGVLYVFIGALQFFQTLLVSSVYDNDFLGFKFSPGSTIFYTSTLFSILLTFYSESVLKTRGLIYGLVISNIAITLFSHFLLVHAESDLNASSIFLEELLSFEIGLFIAGTSLLFIEGVLIIILFQTLCIKLPKLPLLFKILITMSLICLLDSIVFYTCFFHDKENFYEQLIGNIVGKQLTVILLSIMFYIYFVSNIPKRKDLNSKTIKETLKIFTF